MFVRPSTYLKLQERCFEAEKDSARFKATLNERDDFYYKQKLEADAKMWEALHGGSAAKKAAQNIENARREAEVWKTKYTASMNAIGRPII